MFYPHEYWPTTNYLSRLGNFDYSPFGAYFYNIGCVVTGIALFPFFIGLFEWHGSRTISKIIILIGQFLGLLAAVALVLIGVYPENTGQPHMTASALFFLLNFFVLLFIGIGLLFNERFSKEIATYAISFGPFTLILEMSAGGPIVEWITVFGSLVFVTNTIIFTLRARTAE